MPNEAGQDRSPLSRLFHRSSRRESPPVVTLAPGYTTNKQALEQITRCATAIAGGTANLDDARFLALHQNALNMTDAARAWMWTTLGSHYAAHNVPVDNSGSSSQENQSNILAAIKCERFNVPLATAVEEFNSRDWSTQIDPYRDQSLTFSPPSFTFSTFVDGCQRVALVGEIERQKQELSRLEAEAKEHSSGHRHDEFAGMRERIIGLTEQLHISGLRLSNSETAIVGVFGSTRTAKGFVDNSTFVLPKPEPKSISTTPMLSVDLSNHRYQRYTLDRIMQPKKSPSPIGN